MYEAQKLPGVNRQNLTIDHTLFDIDQYYLILHRLLYYAKHRLTTTKIVEYILKVVKYPLDSSQNHSVLFIANYLCDFMKDFMLDGFTRVFKENLHVFSRQDSYMIIRIRNGGLARKLRPTSENLCMGRDLVLS